MPAFKQTVGLAACAVYLQGCGPSQAPPVEKDFMSKYKHMNLEQLQKEAPTAEQLRVMIQKRLEAHQFHQTAKVVAEKTRIAIRKNHGAVSKEAHVVLHQIAHDLPAQMKQLTDGKTIDGAFKEMVSKLEELAGKAPQAETQIKAMAADLSNNLGSYEQQFESSAKQVIPEIKKTAMEGTEDLMQFIKSVAPKDQQGKINELQASVVGLLNKGLNTAAKQDFRKYTDIRTMEEFAKDGLRKVSEYKVNEDLITGGVSNVRDLEREMRQQISKAVEKVQDTEKTALPDVVKFGDDLINQLDQTALEAIRG